MTERDALLTGLSCTMALGCFVSQSCLNVAFVAALVVLVGRLERDNIGRLQRLPGIEWPILLYVVAFLVSAVAGVDANVSFGYITELKRPVIAYVVASSLNTRRDAWMVAFAALLGAWVSTLVAVKQWVLGGNLMLHNVEKHYDQWAMVYPMGLSSTANDLATLLAQALGLTAIPLFFFFRNLTWQQRAGAAITVFALSAGMLRTLSRASLLASLAGLAAAGLALRPKRLLVVFLLLGLIYPMLPASLTSRHGNIFDLSNYSNWFRVRMVEISLQMARDHLPWGIGRRNFAKVHESLKHPDEEISPHAHNNYLQILVEMGILGIVAFVWFQLAVIVYLARLTAGHKHAPPERMLLGAVLMAFVSFTVNGFFHYDWGDAMPASFMWVLVGLGVAVGERLAIKPSKDPDEPPAAASAMPA